MSHRIKKTHASSLSVPIRVRVRVSLTLPAGVSARSGFDVASIGLGWIWFAKIKLIVLRDTTTHVSSEMITNFRKNCPDESGISSSSGSQRTAPGPSIASYTEHSG